MKTKFLVIHVLITFVLSTLSVFTQEVVPNEENALLYIVVVDKKGKPIENAEVTVSSPNLDTVFKLLTTKEGICEFLIPKGHGYSIDLGQIKNADYIEIPDEAYYELESKYYIDREFALSQPELNVNLNVATSEGEPVSERFEIVSLDDESSYTIRTDPSGNAKTQLPAGQNLPG